MARKRAQLCSMNPRSAADWRQGCRRAQCGSQDGLSITAADSSRVSCRRSEARSLRLTADYRSHDGEPLRATLKVQSYEFEALSYEVEAPSFGLEAPGFALEAQSFELEASSFELEVLSFELEAPSYGLESLGVVKPSSSHDLSKDRLSCRDLHLARRQRTGANAPCAAAACIVRADYCGLARRRRRLLAAGAVSRPLRVAVELQAGGA